VSIANWYIHGDDSLTCHNGNKQFEPYIQKSKIYWSIAWGQNPQCSVNPCELVTHLQQMQHCKKKHWVPCLINPNFKHSWTPCLHPSISNIYQVDLELLRKNKKKLVQIWTTYMFLLTSHFYFHFSHSAQPKDTPIEDSNVHLDTWATTWIKDKLNKYL
jgi:hypothetical protein